MLRNLSLYLLVMLTFGAGIFWVLKAGARLQPAAGVAVESSDASKAPQSKDGAMIILLLQVIVVVGAARLAGWLARKIGQPAVVGEMAAGILLGPSFLGLAFPSVQHLVFPPASLGGLRMLSQVGVILFLFVVGLDLDVSHLRRKAHAAVLVSHAGIVIPFFLGLSFSLLIFRPLAPPHVAFGPFALFIGVAMSITAFPVLVRIIEERGLSRSFLGTTAITCAAVDDATAWCLLAFVVAIVHAGSLWSAAATIGLVLAFVLLMLFVVKPLARRVTGLATALVFLFASALITELLGIHALFGAFLAGVVLSANETLRGVLKERLESFSAIFLLPLFFAFTGLRTQIGLLSGWRDWALCAGIVAVAVAGKLGGSMLAARWTGMGWRDAFSIGALMNTRGLVELIALNLGYDLGILPPRIFAMMVIMALFTTVMTGPLLTLAERWRARAEASPLCVTGTAAPKYPH